MFRVVAVEIVRGLECVVPVELGLFCLAGGQCADADEQRDGGVCLACSGFYLEQVGEAGVPVQIEGRCGVVGVVLLEVYGGVSEGGVGAVEGLVEQVGRSVDVHNIIRCSAINVDIVDLPAEAEDVGDTGGAEVLDGGADGEVGVVRAEVVAKGEMDGVAGVGEVFGVGDVEVGGVVGLYGLGETGQFVGAVGSVPAGLGVVAEGEDVVGPVLVVVVGELDAGGVVVEVVAVVLVPEVEDGAVVKAFDAEAGWGRLWGSVRLTYSKGP